jgi:hypothetical protein
VNIIERKKSKVHAACHVKASDQLRIQVEHFSSGHVVFLPVCQMDALRIKLGPVGIASSMRIAALE